MNSEEPTKTIEPPKYKIEYYNRVFKVNNFIEESYLEDAINTAKSISKLFEIENVRIYEIREIKSYETKEINFI